MDAKEFSAHIGYEFKKLQLCEAALTHPSAARHTGARPFERLEFIGDRALGLAVSHLLFNAFEDHNEGFLAHRVATLCSKKQLLKIGQHWQVKKYLYAIGLQTDSANAIADTVEAVLGAIYLDAGFNAVLNVVERFWATDIMTTSNDMDSKSRLQFLLQGKGYPAPSYKIVDKEGPDHSPTYVVEASAIGKKALGTSTTKKFAEQNAAALLLDQIDESKL
ncbi:MAG: ribonuclease III [Alphaproteobacteria bacterium]|nr:ribonuclease III [Alphaproteobacteria bacterium]OJV45517.1 MAG: ribonuclease III [Alphaproteobacteria bacterium 43-37]